MIIYNAQNWTTNKNFFRLKKGTDFSKIACAREGFLTWHLGDMGCPIDHTKAIASVAMPECLVRRGCSRRGRRRPSRPLCGCQLWPEAAHSSGNTLGWVWRGRRVSRGEWAQGLPGSASSWGRRSTRPASDGSSRRWNGPEFAPGWSGRFVSPR